jgi:hypothetical protein
MSIMRQPAETAMLNASSLQLTRSGGVNTTTSQARVVVTVNVTIDMAIHTYAIWYWHPRRNL